MDPAIESDELVTQRDFLRRLARGLLGDDALTEDVVQEAELRALERGPEARDPRTWLATVTRRLALNLRRARERRAFHERAARRPEAVAGHDEALAGLELQQTVLAAVRALDETQRTAIWLRYYEECSPSEIAARLGVPVATVKTRLRRALHALRERLDAEHGGERRAWAVALVPLARSPLPPLAAGSAALGAGGVIVMKKLVVPLALLLLGWLGWRVGRDETPAAPPEVASAREPAATASHVLSSAASVDTAALDVHVVREGDGSPASGVGLVLWPRDVALPEIHASVAETDADGRARFEGILPGAYRVHTDRDVEREAELAAGAARVLEIVLPSGLDVLGNVVDGDGQPVPGAEVWLEGRGTGMLGGRIVTRAAADGSFRLRALGPRQALSAFAPGYAPAPLAYLRNKALAPGESEVHVTLVLEQEGGELLGRVLAPDGTPVPAARVAVGGPGNIVFGGAARPRARLLATDELGVFRAEWIERGRPAGIPCVLVHVLAPAFALAHAERAAAEGDPLVVRLESGATILGRVRAPDGEPVAEARVALLRAGEIRPEGCPFALPSAVTDGDGAFRLEHVPSGEVELVVTTSDRRRGAHATRTLADGESTHWELTTSDAPVIAGRVVDEHGVGLAGRHVFANNGDAMSGLTSAEDGRFVFIPSAPDEETSFELAGKSGVLDRRDGVRTGEEIELVERDVGAMIRGGFTDRADLVRPGDRLVASLATAAAAQVVFQVNLDALGAFVFEQVVPGRYQATIVCGEVAFARSPWFDVAEGESVVLDWLETRPPGSVVLECAPPEGVELGSVRGWLLDLEGWNAVGFEREGGVLRASDLVPGSYRLDVGGPRLASHQQVLEVRPGEELRPAVALRAGVPHHLTFVAPEGVPVRHLRLTLRERGTGNELVREEWSAFASEPLALRVGLAPGSYALEATTDSGVAASSTIDVSTVSAEEAVLRFDLR